MHKEDLRLLRDYVIGWVVALGLWILVRNYGVTPDAPSTPEPHHNLRMLFEFGPLAGLLFGFTQIKFERYLFRRVPLWKLSALWFLINAMVTVVLFVFAYQFYKNVVGFNQEVSFANFIRNPNAIITFFYVLFVNFVMASVREINLLLGKGNLWRFVRGDFYSPRVENRVFMFIDLKGSTSIAEKLGHIKYSRFLQDCFFDLNVIRHSEAEVYQYVGDEVVLSWKVKKHMDYTKCLKAFWAFEDKLNKRHDFYMDKYGLVPKFKAGINLGEVTTAEVGEIKREIAYHGDTMNIAARIQDKCNDYGQTLLVSEYFHSQIVSESICQLELMGEELLRGKNESVKVYAVSRNTK